MKNKFLLGALSLMGAASLVFTACKDEQDIDSVAKQVSIPQIVCDPDPADPDVCHPRVYMAAAYVYGQGQATLQADIPDVVAIAVDTVYGFEGGYGGKTGADTVKITKADIVGDWPDLSGIGGKSVTFQKYTKGNYKVTIGTNVIVAGPIANPGPTAIEGTYKRVGNNFLIEIKKVFDGVYVIDNLGGAGVTPFPFLLYNHKSSSGADSLAFPLQGNECGGGSQLVGPNAATGSSADDYAAQHPPSLTLGPPVTLKWKVYTYSSTNGSAISTAALCTWGNAAVRTFEKQ